MRHHPSPSVRPSGTRPLVAAAALAIGLGLLGPQALAWKPPPGPQPVPLRLDDSPALPLLAPFREASGPASSFLRRYLEGPYGQWRARPWRTLAWRIEPPLSFGDDGGPVSRAAGICDGDACPEPRVLAADSSSCIAPVAAGGAPGGELGGTDTDAELGSLRGERSPLVLSDRHWFQPDPVDLAREAPARAPESLSISTDVVPPWLQRLDEQWAGALLSSSGCGRGGECSADASFPAEAFGRLWDALSPQAWPIPSWKCKPRPVTVMRYGRETDSFELVRCDGSIAPGALDRLSIIARPAGVERPGDLLPDEPDPSASHGEWLPGIRLMHPRLLWVLQAVAYAFPHHPIYVVSGYRPAPSPPPPGTRASYHWEGRAIDISVLGVSNEDLFKTCHGLDDVGCGFYPNKTFVHLDVRHYGDGRVFWIDVSRPGERTKYVDSWPGVVEHGGMAWAPPAAGE